MTTFHAQHAHGITKLASMFLITVLCLTIFPKQVLAQIDRSRNAPVPAGSVATGAKYPHAWFAFEAGALAGAIWEDTHSYSSYENQSAKKFLAINLPIGVAAGFAGWKLQNSQRKPLRVLGHVVMWGAISGYSIDYFKR